MGKQVKITEEELHSLIKSKILEAVEDIKKLGKNLGYAPAIGNKKRGPGDDIEDQMAKRKNKKLDEDFDEAWKPIYRRLPDGDMDYDGDEWDGGPADSGNFELELSDEALTYALEKVAGIKTNGNDDDFIDTMMRRIGFDGMVTINLDFNVTSDKGDYWTPPSSDVELNNWEISPRCPYYSEASEMGKKIMQVAADYEMDRKDATELYELISESKTIKLTQSQVHNIIKESVRRILRENKMWDAMCRDMKDFAVLGKDVYDFLEYATEKYGIDEDQFYTSGGYEAWCELTGEDPMSYEY